ncbi:MAG: hypothetical protein E6455_11550, partial [Streptococcus salivarius]|nr:hypothetical protein [Streptococcus salivarius]
LVAQSREQKGPKPQRIESHNDSFSLKIFPFYKDNTIILKLNKIINFFRITRFIIQNQWQDAILA